MNQSSMSQAQPRWYVLQTKPQQEARVRDALHRQHYNCVLPMLPGSADEPLFPRYIFVQLANVDSDAAAVRRIAGVTGLLKLDQECAPVHDSIVATLDNTLANTAMLRAGPFALLNDVHEIPCGIERALELIETVCRPHPAAASGPLLRAA